MKFRNIFSFGRKMVFACLLLMIASCENELEEYWDPQLPGEGYVTDGSVSSNAIMYGESVTYTDLSTDVLSRTWTFPGGSPSTSTEQSVEVTYGTGGSFAAKLEVYHSDNLKVTVELPAVEVEGPQMLAWSGSPLGLPGLLEFENYDIGGEGVSYHDTEAENKADATHSYRTDDGIDIEVGSDRINIGYSNADEWMNYTVNVAEAGMYDFDFVLASGSSTGATSLKIQLVDGETVTDLGETGDIANTGGWGVYTNLLVEGIELAAGEQVIRFYYTSGGLNLDNVNIISQSPVADKYGIYTEGATVLGSVGELTINDNQAVLHEMVADAAEGTEAIKFGYAWASGVWGYMAEILPVTSPVDLSAFATGYYNISIKTTSVAAIKLRFQSDGVQGYVVLDDAVKTYGLERDGNWHSLKIPMTDFKVDGAGANPDYSAITHLLVFRSVSGVAEGEDYDWYVDNIYLTKE